ncbi:hypothetical protein CCACVL1_10086 [Corchorus capsularis]|uniref:t-SNARE coiled-coil homology domain-containing protein n=1 Tax=Corchorus capsularis TaxID=210143 RepID=A0A1R3ISR6_COCAP|nr:hypothetical protein CCACVL1_10086 [Corchorus capsularis]
MSFQDVRGGSRPSSSMASKSPSQAVAAGIFQINTAVAAFLRLVDAIGTAKDTPDHRQKLHNTRQKILQLVKDTSAKLKALSESDHDPNVNPSKKIEDAKLARDFQTTLQEFQKVQQLASERESTYSPAAPPPSLPTTSASDDSWEPTLPQEKQPFVMQQRRQELVLLDNEIAFNEAMIEEREQGIREVEVQIGEVNDIFKDLAVLVNDQGVIIDDISSNIDSSSVATTQARVQLARASKSVKSRTSWCWWVLAIVVLALVEQLREILVILIDICREEKASRETEMAGLLYQLFASSTLLSLGIYNLICTTRNLIKSPQSYSAKPFHPPPPFSSSPRLKYLPLYLLLLCLFIAFLHQFFISFDPDPLLKGRTPVHRFTALHSAAVLFLFFILSLFLLLSDSTSLLPLPSDLFFAFASALFFLQYSVSSSAAAVQTSDLQAKCDSLSALISALASLMCLILACQPKLFVAEVGLGAALCLQGFWELQTGLSLYVDAFIPEGCHKLLDVVSGVEGSTKCDLDESKLRAVAILDLLFVVHVMFVVIIVMLTYALVAKTVGVRRLGSYEPLPTNAADSNHIQMKALAGTQA